MQYSQDNYWDERYKRNPEIFDSYQGYTGLKETFNEHVAKENEILHFGAGTSVVGEEMYKDGYKYITNCDLSTEVVKVMKERYGDKFPGMEYVQMDIRALSDIEDKTYHTVIEKGTMDSLLYRAS
eukprot:TRINITY_DN7032_c0_g1_i1.p1 TRINITY_DN7032_c0_g1~~TRINITY_DN7032_c0_g1_i1.p1  ORF type:complete len:125 (+),score=43.58 TRINITY_DN7032_c0_g1_i1:65-439(+)